MVNLDDLEVGFRSLIDRILGELNSSSAWKLKPTTTIRDPWTQAKLWRQSRTGDQVQREIQQLIASDAEYLASVLQRVGPQKTGPWATNALPGMSWHNWSPSLAIDVVVIEAGKVVGDGHHPGYRAWINAGASFGLTSRANIHDYGHMQANAFEPPDRYDLREISLLMKGCWGNIPPK